MRKFNSFNHFSIERHLFLQEDAIGKSVVLLLCHNPESPKTPKTGVGIDIF